MRDTVDRDELIGAVARAIAEDRVVPCGGARPEAIHEIYCRDTGSEHALKTLRDHLNDLVAEGRLAADWGVEGQPRRGFRPVPADSPDATPTAPRYPSEVAHD